MQIHSINDIEALHETHQVEYKRARNSFPKDGWETYSSFANTSGGYLILGLSEDDSNMPVLSGVSDVDKVIDEFCSSLANRNKVSINVIQNEDISVAEIDNKKIIIIYISEARLEDKPVFINNNLRQTFLRIRSQDHLVDTNQLGALLRNKSESLDYELLNNYSISDLDIDSINSYKGILAKRYPQFNYQEMNNQHFLESIGVFRKDRADNLIKLTLGGLLFFGKYNTIIEYFPHYHLDFFDKRGNKERWSFRIESGNLDFPDLNLFNYYRLVQEKLLLSVERDFQLDAYTIRKNPTDLSIAIREAFVNMIIRLLFKFDGINC